MGTVHAPAYLALLATKNMIGPSQHPPHSATKNKVPNFVDLVRNLVFLLSEHNDLSLPCQSLAPMPNQEKAQT
jgi:hypothetical protein